MCRYARQYKSHYVCFRCRKAFKRRLASDVMRGSKVGFEAKCPECGALLANMGLDFETPKKVDLKAWAHMESLYSVGVTFHSCGCTGPGYIPESKETLIASLAKTRSGFMDNIEFWRNRTEPQTKREKEIDSQKNWYELSMVSANYKKVAVKNQEGIAYWLGKVKEVEDKIKLIK